MPDDFDYTAFADLITAKSVCIQTPVNMSCLDGMPRGQFHFGLQSQPAISFLFYANNCPNRLWVCMIGTLRAHAVCLTCLSSNSWDQDASLIALELVFVLIRITVWDRRFTIKRQIKSNRLNPFAAPSIFSRSQMMDSTCMICSSPFFGMYLRRKLWKIKSLNYLNVWEAQFWEVEVTQSFMIRELKVLH